MANFVPYKSDAELAKIQMRFALDAAAPLIPDQYNLEELKKSLDTDTLTTIANELGTRNNPELFHDGTAEVDDDAVLEAATRLGMVIPRVLHPMEETEAELGICSIPKPCPEKAKAIVVMGAAGLSPLKRLYHAIWCIESGAVDTDTIIVAAGKRQTTEAERGRMEEAGFTPGDTEYDLCKLAVSDLSDCEMHDAEDAEVILGSHTLPVHRAELEVELSVGMNLTKKVKIIVIECPFDPDRKLENGNPATRPNTEENLLAVKSVLGLKGGDTLYLVSHDCWVLGQLLIAERVLPECIIYGSGPQNLDRITPCVISGEPKLGKARDVQDEIRKVLLELIKRLH